MARYVHCLGHMAVIKYVQNSITKTVMMLMVVVVRANIKLNCKTQSWNVTFVCCAYYKARLYIYKYTIINDREMMGWEKEDMDQAI